MSVAAGKSTGFLFKSTGRQLYCRIIANIIIFHIFVLMAYGGLA